MEKGRESGPSSAAYPTWDIRSEKRDCEQRSTMKKGGVHVKRKSHITLGGRMLWCSARVLPVLSAS